MATATQEQPTNVGNEKSDNQALRMHKDHLSADELDLKDPYVASALGLYAIHNVIRRNLASCAKHAESITESNSAPFASYAKYTVYVLKDQLDSVDTMWFPKFAVYDKAFTAQIDAHQQIILPMVAELEGVLKSSNLVQNAAILSERFEKLDAKVNEEFDTEERLVNELGLRVPIGEIRDLEKKQEGRRQDQVKQHGHLWTAAYLLRGLAPKERAIFPPGIPKVVMSGMLTAGALQYRKELQFSPKF